MPDTDPPQLDPPTQDRLIADALIEDIVEWRIKPGAWIREREIAQRFGVSHAPVREAFRHVANLGFIQIVPWRGAHVIEIDRHAATEVLELWKAMFGVVCRLAAQAMSPEDGVELLKRLETYKDVVRRTRNTFEHLATSNRIGAFIARRSGCQLASALLDRIALFARWQHHVIEPDFFTAEAAQESADIYESLCRHIVNRRADEADEAARALLGFLQNQFRGPLDAYLSTRVPGPPAPKTARKN